MYVNAISVIPGARSFTINRGAQQLDGFLSDRWKRLKKKIRTDIDPRRLKEKYAQDMQFMQNDLNKVVSPKAKERLEKIAKLQEQKQAETEAIHTEELDTERARRQQIITSGLTLAGLGVGAVAFVMLSSRKRRK